MEKVKGKECFRIEYPNTKAGKKDWNKRYGVNAYYAGKHWSQRQQDAEYWHNMTRACMERAGVRKRPFERPVSITFHWNSNLDLDNHSIMGKFIVDAMCGRLIQGDSRRWVKEIRHLWHDEDYIRVEVKEV